MKPYSVYDPVSQNLPSDSSVDWAPCEGSFLWILVLVAFKFFLVNKNSKKPNLFGFVKLNFLQLCFSDGLQ